MGDEGVEVVAAEGAAAGAEVDDEIGEVVEMVVGIGGSRRTVVGWAESSGLPVMAVVDGAERRWLTVEIGVAPGGVVVVVGFLHLGKKIKTLNL